MSTPDLLGSDISGTTEMDYAMTTVRGRLALMQAIVRRMTTERGSLIGSPEYGYDLMSAIGSTQSVSVVQQRVQEQVLQEAEVEDCRVTATYDSKTSTLTVTVQVVDADGPFDLTLTADTLTISAIADGVVILKAA